MTRRKTHEEFVAEVFNLVENEYSVLGEYRSTHTKIKIRHEKCGYEYDVEPSKFLIGRRCPDCFSNKKKTTEQFKQEVYDLVGSEYEVLGEYSNTDFKILMRHCKCGHEWYIKPDNFIRVKRRCPKCKFSKGEAEISSRLSENLITHKPQFTFEDCRNKNPLPFDFAVFNNKNNLMCLIEYDGEGHFEPFRFSKDKSKMIEKLKTTQKHDRIKNKYCIDNCIPLIRIPYWEFNRIEEILYQYLIEPIDNFEGSFLIS